jgi:signal transduction histidine kinase
MEGNGCLVTHIDDTGMGIRKEDIKKLFKFFGQIDKNTKQNEVGIGMGLTTAKMIVS